ncbi:hypothetical protein COX86_01395 [Candidatus Micrarchaeota archaeon CG_4_10_14_0_2_um_filter_60_11]|nr:MAG: hypothetical protein AUJ16_01345 [Candidatus Micrarchaeota archaeon CG1_02_60_51]PIO01736.1 MAG: hypothetical protein COT58_03645 [Candidatus Micrarchaeota archaeon CG09_land_8_20_14_0_10_60_16]PIZ91116.1 MAG: hypothetical protein COX86_01395 [Candidatus Micrarchaeota archaeon CG_4_10_14_0_2_um_filter_60_11]
MNRVIGFLFPKDGEFFNLLAMSGLNANDACKELVELFESFDSLSPDELAGRVNRIHNIETRNDDLTLEITRRIHSTFITPLDREDIHELAVLIDDYVNLVDSLAKKASYYGVAQMPPAMKLQAKTALEQIGLVNKVIRKMERMQRFEDEKKLILALEDEADAVHRAAITELFASERDPVNVIKVKDLLEHAERLTDKSPEIARALEAIVIKHA